MNKIYTSFKNSRMFPVIDKDGVAQVATYAEHGGYIVISSVKWIHIEAIRFYSDFISIQIKDRKDIELGGTLIHIMADNALKYKDEIASIWAYALKNPNDKLGLMLYSEKEENEIFPKFLLTRLNPRRTVIILFCPQRFFRSIWKLPALHCWQRFDCALP